MSKRLWWSIVLPMTALCLLAFEASAQPKPTAVIRTVGPQGLLEYSPGSSPKRPGLINPLCGLMTGPSLEKADCDSQDGREWEGIASTDYFSFVQEGVAGSTIPVPNPDIAAGPDDIVATAGKKIVRYPNPNAPLYNNNNGTASVAYNPTKYIFPPTAQQFIDTWIGEAAINEMCPTFPRNSASCIFDNLSVRYDQMQGRFVVLFTVVDTGLLNCSGCAGTPTPISGALRRKASWVLVTSRWAVGCQGTGGGFSSACVPDPLTGTITPGAPPLTGNTEFFTTPQPPGPTQTNPNSGGTNGNWLIYYGSTGAASTTQGNDGICPSGGCPFGNINTITDLQRGSITAPTGAVTIDCNNTATLGTTTTVCYFPSSARLGLDNDNIIISSSVYNDNIQLPARVLPGAEDPTANPPLQPAWEGTRVRVFKKAAVYIGGTSTPACVTTALPCPGAAQASPQVQGDFYDLWGNSAKPYSFDRLVTHTFQDGAVLDLTGMNYEPWHVRGRSLASYNGNANLANAFSVLVGALNRNPGTGAPTNATPLTPIHRLYMRSITYTRKIDGTLDANTGAIPATVNQPLIVGGIPALQPLQNWIVPAFKNPQSVTQRDKLVQPAPNNQLPTPFLYVGDDRPHRVIGREGLVYDARVGFQADLFQVTGATDSATVIYDIVQKLTAASTPIEIYNTTWGNGRFYAPMYEVPANVVQYGSISPINLLPFLEKLFVGTTYPPLSPSDPRTFNYGNITGVALQACKGQEPAAPANNLGPTVSGGAYPGLFDIRCGEDAYDTAAAYRNPISGAFTPTDFGLQPQPSGFPNQIVPFGTRGGASTDVNNMGLWMNGAYAKGRLAGGAGPGQWGTYISHYPLSFPIRDPYNNLNVTYSDVQPGHPHFVYVQIAKQTEIDPGSRTALTFNPSGTVLRRDMAKWVVRSQMDETAITLYLNSTGGIFCSFADVECPGATGTVTNTTGTAEWRYIETMYRRGYTKGCSDDNDGQRRFCPGRTLTRGEMSVFVIRAKMNSVFPTVTSGSFTTSTCSPPGTVVTQVGDQFGLFAGCRPYFSDVASTHPYFAFIQKLRELRISNGTTLSTPTTLGTYEPDRNLTRSELMTFLVRGFFP